MKQNILALAVLIRAATKELLRDTLYKEYRVSVDLNIQASAAQPGEIIVKNDAGHRAIIIGDLTSHGKGYIYIFLNNNGGRFPSVATIAKALKKVREKTADRPEFQLYPGDDNDVEKTKEFLSDVVKRHLEQIPKF